MLDKDKKKELLNQLNEKKKKILDLKSKLNELNDQKEHWFHKKEEISKKIRSHISTIKNSKRERNVFTKQVKDSKGKREDLNKQIKDKINEVKKLNKEKKDIATKYGIEGDPSALKSQINKLEQKIETEPMSFDNERKIMKKIKEMKKKYDEALKVSNVWKKIHDVSKDIDKLKRKADSSHKSIQSKAKDSQEKHEEMVGASKEVNDLKKKEEEAYKKFLDFKAQFTKLNNELKELLPGINKIRGDLDLDKKEAKKIKELKKQKTLDEKRKEVQDKLSSGKKITLTTEDLLAFQGMQDKK